MKHAGIVALEERLAGFESELSEARGKVKDLTISIRQIKDMLKSFEGVAEDYSLPEGGPTASDEIMRILKTANSSLNLTEIHKAILNEGSSSPTRNAVSTALSRLTKSGDVVRHDTKPPTWSMPVNSPSAPVPSDGHARSVHQESLYEL